MHLTHLLHRVAFAARFAPAAAPILRAAALTSACAAAAWQNKGGKVKRSAKAGGAESGVLRFYTEDSPGLRM